jgi:serine/threonine protein kinase
VLNELEVLRMMDHPNVIIMHECYESKKYVHLLLPLLEGGELFDRIKSKGLYKESDALPVMKNLFSALEYLAT